ncbi:Protein F37C4,5 [Ceratobasidium theobromae]|uniref:Protein F37C4,5 n=1 Tax=Ceratobasidium theobromae TaxID=1582974 RepID=A0A5N5QL07_9AGAM|nr:Protein F37C4,5 [Ceratobasidium theobromae]
MVSGQPAANRIAVNAAEQDGHIESVTVFQSDRAEIKRRVNLELKQGQNHVHIERLPSCVNEDSIRVDGTGTAVIFDVVYHAPQRQTTRSSNEAVATARRKLESVQKERDIAREQSGFLAAYGRTLDSKNLGIEDVQKFIDMFGPRQVEVAKRIQELDVQVSKAQEELNEAQRKVYEDAEGERRGTRITVTVLAETDGEAELMLTYGMFVIKEISQVPDGSIIVVSNARWTPLYDIRASIAKSPDASSTVSLHYRASITQTTGENWPDVELTLSTASPQLGSAVPTLTSWRIGPRPPPLPVALHAKGIAMKRASRAIESEASDEDMGFGLFDGTPPATAAHAAPMIVRQARVATAGVLSATFGIPGRSDIPSDQSSHKVVITVLELGADLEWVCVPREKESVFLTCKVVNASEFTLLPGEANVFMDDNFVSKSRIEHVSPNDSFKTSLGVDSALRVTYPTAKTLNRTTTLSSFAFMSKERQSVSAQSQRIIIRNSRPASVSTLRVLDHVPVSTDSRIKVTVIAPGGLDAGVTPPLPAGENADKGKGKERPWVNAQKGVQARWAPLDTGGEGTVEWKCEIPPTEEIELELSWEVWAPVSQPWQNL